MAGTNFFAYGTLLFDEIIECLLGYLPDSESALITNYKRYAIAGESYPVLVGENDCETHGRLFYNLNNRDFAILDSFEEVDAEEYIRQSCEVNTSKGNVCAEVYIASKKLKVKRMGDWDPKDFKENQLQSYLRVLQGGR